jgi:hypothetical protein
MPQPPAHERKINNINVFEAVDEYQSTRMQQQQMPKETDVPSETKYEMTQNPMSILNLGPEEVMSSYGENTD